MARFAPARFRQFHRPRCTAPACPAITTWSGELKFAAETTSPCAAFRENPVQLTLRQLQQRRHGADARRHGLLHKLSAIPNQPDGIGKGERCRPRPAPSIRQDCARPRNPGSKPRSGSTRQAAVETAKQAPVECSPSASAASSGPSKQSVESEKPSASSASSKDCRAPGTRVSQAYVPMPANCDPWPGNKKAVFIMNSP